MQKCIGSFSFSLGKELILPFTLHETIEALWYMVRPTDGPEKITLCYEQLMLQHRPIKRRNKNCHVEEQMDVFYSLILCVSDPSLNPTVPSAARSEVRNLNTQNISEIHLPASDKVTIKRACHQLLISDVFLSNRKQKHEHS